MNIDSKDQKVMPMDYMKLEQAARALLAHWDTPAWKYLKPTGDLMADLREALEQPVIMSDNYLNGYCTGRTDLLAEQAEQEPVAKALRLSEEAIEYARQGGKIGSGIYGKALAAIRSAKEPQITTPDVCGEVCVRAKLCYGCNKDLEEANAKCAKQAEQEPIRFVWNGTGWIEADEYVWKTTPDAERRELYAAPQPDMNLNCKSVQKRLATVWGYVKAEQAEQEPFDMNDHPPHRLCECRKCMEYFTPLPDCDAFAAPGKPIAEQKNTQFMEGYRIGLAEMREKCAKVCDDKHDYMCSRAAAAIRAINFEGDTGFRPVSEMIAEHKQDPKKAAAIEKAKMRKAEQKPVAVVEITYGREPECYVTGNIDDFPEGVFKLYAAPVRTKDLTGQDLCDLEIAVGWKGDSHDFDVIVRAVIAKFKEKNK